MTNVGKSPFLMSPASNKMDKSLIATETWTRVASATSRHLVPRPDKSVSDDRSVQNLGARKYFNDPPLPTLTAPGLDESQDTNIFLPKASLFPTQILQRPHKIIVVYCCVVWSRAATESTIKSKLW